MVPWLLESFGMGDIDRGVFYYWHRISFSLSGVFLGTLVDYLYVRKTLLIHLFMLSISNIVLGIFTQKPVLWGVGVAFQAVGFGIGVSAQPIAVRRYVKTDYQNIGFSMLYSVMQIGAILAFASAELMRMVIVPAVDEFAGKGRGWQLCQLIIGIIRLSAFLVTMFGIRDVEVAKEDQMNDEDRDTPMDDLYVTDNEDELEPCPPQEDESKKKWAMVPIVRSDRVVFPGVKRSCQNFWVSMKDRILDLYFFKYLLLSLCLVPVQSIFSTFDTLYPAFMQRAPFGVDNPENFTFYLIEIINPLLVLAFATLISRAIVRRNWHLFYTILAGSVLSAGSPFFMATVSYWGVVLFEIFLSFGEMIWSPQLDAYVMYFAPKGKEGLFFAISRCFLTVIRGALGYASGYLLAEFCHAKGDGCSRGYLMWVIVGCFTCLTPILLSIGAFFLKIEHREPPPRIQDITIDNYSEIDLSSAITDDEDEEPELDYPAVSF